MLHNEIISELIVFVSEIIQYFTGSLFRCITFCCIHFCHYEIMCKFSHNSSHYSEICHSQIRPTLYHNQKSLMIYVLPQCL